MIAVKEGADVEVVVKPNDQYMLDAVKEPVAFDAVRKELNKQMFQPAEFDENLHETILKLMARNSDLYATDDIIKTARQICDACKIKP